MKSRNPIIEFDKLKMFFGLPYVIDLADCEGSISITQPSILDMVKMGEKKFYSTISIFTTNTTSYRLMLWESGIDWNEISDFDLFLLLYKGIDPEVSKMIFGDLDWEKFQLYEKDKEDVKTRVLYDSENHIEINEEVYWHFSQYIRKTFNMEPEEKLTNDPILKRQYITKDQHQQDINKQKEEKGLDSSSSILSLISSCLNHPGFKYDLEGLGKMNVCQFYDSVKRLQVYENSTACLKGLYSGFVSSKDIPADNYNFMKDI